MNTNTGLSYFYKKRPFIGPCAFVLSIILHIVLFCLLTYLTKTVPIETISADNKEEQPIKVTFNPPEVAKEPKKLKPKEPKSKVLTQESPKSPFSVPSRPSKKPVVPEKSQGLEKFLPRSNPQFLNKMRQQRKSPTEITGDGGDIPMKGTDRRRDIPRVVERFEHKDMSLYQFSKMFHDRFGAVWNSTDRNVPRHSPLRPGNVVYYKVFINPDGTLSHFENLTNKMYPNLDTEALDVVFEDVIAKTLPMKLPARLEKNIQVTEVVAIQVVDKTLFMNFGR